MAGVAGQEAPDGRSAAGVPEGTLPALPTRQAVAMFGAFAFAYLLSALVRGVTATLAPVFSAELGLNGAQLGLLAGAYFLGFAAMQLPLGQALDRHGPRRVELVLLVLGVLGCAAFARAQGLEGLLLSRLLIGVGVAACLMAPLTAFRRRFPAEWQLRANAWMLMSGSLGMLASTLPVQWLLPSLGWRGLFVGVALLMALAAAGIAGWVPRDRRMAESVAPAPPAPVAASATGSGAGAVAGAGALTGVATGAAVAESRVPGYGAVLRHPVFIRCAPLGLVVYGGLIGLQSLWIGPWLTLVAGQTAGQAAQGLFIVNASMLAAFAAWGAVMPRLQRAGWDAVRLVQRLWPLGPAWLALVLWLGPRAGAWHWALWCVLSSAVTVLQPMVGQAFALRLAGRALSAFNLVVFVGVFAVQWGVGAAADQLRLQGQGAAGALRGALALLCGACVLAGLWFWRGGRRPSAARTPSP